MEEKLFLTVDETASLLTVKSATIYSWIHYKQLPEQVYKKLGRKVVFIRQALLDWVYSGAEIKKRNA